MCDDCGGHGTGEDGHDHGKRPEHGHGHHDHSHDDGRGVGPDHTHVDEQVEQVFLDSDKTVRIAVTGKGGVGKTTLSAAIARHLAAHGDVVAIDADPDMNLASAIGVEAPPPVTGERELIEERAGGGGLVSLTPEVRDVLDSHSTEFGPGGRLLTIGAPAVANGGCMCPENSFVRSLVSTALSEDNVVMDMEAGIEHLGRGTADSVDAMVVVVEPSRASIETAARIADLAEDLGIETVRAVVNKTREDGATVRDALGIPVAATLPYDEAIATAGLAGSSPVLESEALGVVAAEVVAEVLRSCALPVPDDT